MGTARAADTVGRVAAPRAAVAAAVAGPGMTRVAEAVEGVGLVLLPPEGSEGSL